MIPAQFDKHAHYSNVSAPVHHRYPRAGKGKEHLKSWGEGWLCVPSNGLEQLLFRTVVQLLPRIGEQLEHQLELSLVLEQLLDLPLKGRDSRVQSFVDLHYLL